MIPRSFGNLRKVSKKTPLVELFKYKIAALESQPETLLKEELYNRCFLSWKTFENRLLLRALNEQLWRVAIFHF